MKKRFDFFGYYLFMYYLCVQMYFIIVINKFVLMGIEYFVNQLLKKVDFFILVRLFCILYNGNFFLMKENYMKNIKFVIYGQVWFGEVNK